MSHSSNLAGIDASWPGHELAPAPRRARALLVDVDPALATLVAEWLDAIGVDSAVPARTGFDGCDADVVIVDVPYPRQEGARRLRELNAALPAPPILALWPTFFAGVAASGSVARELGVAGVLATPVRREALVAAVQRLLERPA